MHNDDDYTIDFTAFLSALFINTALAQQATPNEKALSNKLLAELSADVLCEASQISLNEQLAAANARIEELEDKYEKKK